VFNRAALCPLCFFHFILGIDIIVKGVEGAITGSSSVQVTHMLYADDLCLTANRPDQLQTMSFFCALAWKCAVQEGDSKNNLLILLEGLTLETQALFILTTLELRM